MNSKKAIYVVIVVITIAFGAIGYLVVTGDKSGVFGVQPRPNLVRDDFPDHNIDIEKYFVPKEVMWDPKVQISKLEYRGFMETHSDTYTPFEGYMSLYDAKKGSLFEDEVIGETEDYWQNPELDDEAVECGRRARSDTFDLVNQICVGERIESELQVIRMRERQERIEAGIILPGDAEELAEFESDPDVKYHFCSLPKHVYHEIKKLEINENHRCEQEIRSKIKNTPISEL